MAFSTYGLVLSTLITDQAGVQDPGARTRLALVGGLLGYSTSGIVLTSVLARREADSEAPTVPPTLPPTGRVAVPGVTGLSISAAQLQLQALGLSVQSQLTASTTTPKDLVINQSPAAGTIVPAGSVVTLIVSQGIRLPDVTGRSFADAQQQLQAIGMVVQRTDQLNTTVPIGAVITQNPPGGSSVSAGSVVMLTVSLGANVNVPDVVGQKFDSADGQLKILGLQVNRVDQNSNAINKDFVISQDPKAGTPAPVGGTVTLTVSAGQGVSVPDVVSHRFDDAKKEIEALGLKVGSVSQSSEVFNEGFVISQNPLAGAKVDPGSTVTLTVSTGGVLVELPDLKGKDFNVAREILQDLDLGVRRTDVESDTDCEVVVDQDPKPGKVRPETKVTLSVNTCSQAPNRPKKATGHRPPS
jgi:serine/threonine-protein kinase